jgi:hypothetical protein
MDGWVYGWMQDVLAFEWLDKFYSNSTFKSLNMLDRCQVNMNIPDQKTACPNIAPPPPKPKTGIYLKNGFNDFYEMSEIY